jgi:cysteine desulfurase
MQAYFDHNATTPLDEGVLAEMLPFLRQEYGNASSRHDFGTRARRAVDKARERIAAMVNVQPVQVVFVSGGTEANNLFMRGAAAYLKPSQVVISGIEHPCVAKPAQDLARQGWKLRKLATDSQGRVDVADAELALREPTGLVSVMLANNETGVIQPVAEIAAMVRDNAARDKKAWMHTDAVQALGKIAVDFEALGVHAMSLSAHKICGPKGIGALVVDKRLELKPIIHGGGHEGGRRSGTENVPAIVGFGAACELATRRMEAVAQRTRAFRDRTEEGAVALGARIFGRGAQRIPNTTYFAFPDIDGETLVIELDKAGFAVASGAACSSTSTEPSATLLAMGVAPEQARGAVRVSFGAQNTAAEVEDFLNALDATVSRLRRLTAIAV